MYLSLKRLFDLLIASSGVIVLSPFILLVWIIIKSESPKDPAIYLGKRTARNSGTFNLYKFRTMVVNAEELGGFSTAENDPRLTKIGKFLRSFKVDELPQLFNVIQGQMSLVGPRPQVTFYTDKYNAEEKEILKMKPGITDLASLFFINMDVTLGNEDVDRIYENRIEPLKNKLRLLYVKNASIYLDILILIATFLRIFGLKTNQMKRLFQFFYPKLKLELQSEI